MRKWLFDRVTCCTVAMQTFFTSNHPKIQFEFSNYECYRHVCDILTTTKKIISDN